MNVLIYLSGDRGTVTEEQPGRPSRRSHQRAKANALHHPDGQCYVGCKAQIGLEIWPDQYNHLTETILR
jgi:hypothetical protein